MAHENYVLLLSFCLILWCTPSCKKVFEYTPYSAQLANGYDEITTEKNIQKISGAEKQTGSFKIAILADSHYFIDELAEAVNTINSRNDIAFTIVAGDMSDQGLEKEYMQLYDQLKRLKTPLFTVIGNHDYLANITTPSGTTGTISFSSMQFFGKRTGNQTITGLTMNLR